MSVNIRTADLQADRQRVVGLLRRNLEHGGANERFDWLYHRNPYGVARAWIAIDQTTGEAVGVAAAFPRRSFAKGTIRDVYVMGDFCLDHQHRALGLAVQLQRTCFLDLGPQLSSLSYDFPSDRMMAVYRRIKIDSIRQSVRWSKPLRANRLIRRAINSPGLTRLFSAPVNRVLRLNTSRIKGNGKYQVTEHRDRCGPEFSSLAEEISCAYGICVARTAEYLNWRYADHPSIRYQILAARSGDKLRGYIVVSEAANDAKIVDFFAVPEPGVWTSLLSGALMLLQHRPIFSLNFAVLGTSFLSPLLKTWGFIARESFPVVTYGASDLAGLDSPWFLTDGDRES